MANDFDQFPVYDPVTKIGTNTLSDVWLTFMATFWENLVLYLSSFGMFVPRITTDQRDSIQSPQQGQMIYNTTIDAPQIYQAGPPGAWKTFTTV